MSFRKLFQVVAILAAIAFSGALRADPVPSGMDASVQVTFRQKEARAMLRLINEFRAGPDSWYWNDDGKKTKTGPLKLDPLEYDYALEKAAMQRAIEIVVAYGHPRPDGSDCVSVLKDYGYGFRAYGENIAYGQRSAEEVFVAWREDPYDYDGQGHRRNMLSTSCTRIGIACVVSQGTKYWVQEFAKPTSGDSTKETKAADETVRTSPAEWRDGRKSRKDEKPNAAPASSSSAGTQALLSAYLSAAQRRNFSVKLSSEEQAEYPTLLTIEKDKSAALQAIKTEREALIRSQREAIAKASDPESARAEARTKLKVFDDGVASREKAIAEEADRKSRRLLELNAKLR